jgi:transposase
VRVVSPCGCGMDIPKRFVVACPLATAADGGAQKVTRAFGTMTDEVRGMVDWLAASGCPRVAVESASADWRPIANLLEGRFPALVAKADRIKAVPGRTTDAKDAVPVAGAPIADLLRHGLPRGRFIPAPDRRRPRDLARYRAHPVGERARLINRLRAVREDANVKLASVVTDVRGASARAILEALLAGEPDSATLAELARGRPRSKRDRLARAVAGRFTAHHAFVIAERLGHLDHPEEALDRVGTEIAQRLRHDSAAIDLLDTVPGISRRAAASTLAELGADLGRFPRAKHPAAWAGMCPGTAEGGGKRLNGATRTGNQWLRQVPIDMAQAAAKTKGTDLAAQHRRIAARRGKQRALVALGHTTLVIVDRILTRQQPHHELGAASFDQMDRHRVEQRLVRRLGRLGYAVKLQPLVPAPGQAA